MKKELTVVYSANEQFMFYAAVSMYSLLLHSKPEELYHIILLTDKELQEEAAGLFERLEDTYPNLGITVRVMDGSYFVPGKLEKGCGSEANYYRLLLAWMYPELDRCLYIDADTLICDNIFCLGQVDMEGNILAGALDRMMQMTQTDGRLAKKLGIKDLSSYINSGILLMDLKQIREQKLTELFLEEMKTPYVYFDQDIFNKICYGKIKLLDGKYNCLPHFREEVNNMAVLHFAGLEMKPWQNLRMMYSPLWWEKADFFKDTAWYRKAEEEAARWGRQRDINELVACCKAADSVFVWGTWDISNALTRMLCRQGVDNIRYRIVTARELQDNQMPPALQGMETVTVESMEWKPEDLIVVPIDEEAEVIHRRIHAILRERGIPEENLFLFFFKTRDYYRVLNQKYFFEEMRELLKFREKGDAYYDRT